MKKTALVYMAIVLALLMAPAVAAPPSGPTGGIQLSAPAVAAAADGSSTVYPSYGDYASFDVWIEGKLSKQSRTYVTVVCWVNGSIEYQWSGDPDFAFPLADQPGQGLDWPEGAAADCQAHLMYRVEKGKNVEMTTLDVTSFSVAGN